MKKENPRMSLKIIPPSAGLIALLRDIGASGRYLLRGDRTHGFQVRYHKKSMERNDKTLQGLPFLACSSWIEFACEPLDPFRYYRVRLTARARVFLWEHEE
ncbi:hypothetical protein ACSN7O_004822 [Enterobacter chuandaensis]